MSPILAIAGGDKEAAAAAELPSSSRHLRAFGVVVIISIIAGIKKNLYLISLSSSFVVVGLVLLNVARRKERK
jgi:hypothetical protein